MRTTVVGAMILTAWLVVPVAASAQTKAANQPDRWAPWVGCWTLATENVREGAGTSLASALMPGRNGALVPVDLQQPLICVARSGDGVTITTTAPDQPAITQTLVADGSPHEFVDGDCRGVERTEWSTNGTRLIAHADVRCADKTPQLLTGLGLITREGHWLDIRGFRIDGQDATRVSRYRRVNGVRISGAPLSIDEIKEATRKVSSTIVEAAIAETRPQYSMSKRMLLDLADAQIPSNVIDVMVAVSYPDKFVVEKQRPVIFSSAPSSAFIAPSFVGMGPCMAGPAGFGGFDESYCGPYGYSYFGAHALPGYYSPAACCIGSGGGGGPAYAPGPNEPARAINGQGYTRIHPVGEQHASSQPVRVSNSGGTGSVSSSDSSGGSTASVSVPRGGDSGSSSGGSASPSGYSGGGGGGGGGDSGGGRTAVPR